MTPVRPIDAIDLGFRYRQDLGDLRPLAESIEEVGLLHPVVVTPEGRLIAGQRRLAACRLLGWAEVPVTVVEAAEEEPEEYGHLVEQMDRSGKVAGAFRRLTVLRQVKDLETAPPGLPAGPFQVIVADPPWRYESGNSLPYPTMDIEEIKAMRVCDIADEDAILWLWTTNAHLRAAFDVVEAWGFQYRALLTWVKDRMGTGEWLRGQTEHCLLGVLFLLGIFHACCAEGKGMSYNMLAESISLEYRRLSNRNIPQLAAGALHKVPFANQYPW